MQTIKTFLPLFPGFYSTIFELKTDNFCSENNCNDDYLKIDYEHYKHDVVDSCIDFIVDNCDFIKSAKLEKICSPKTYNFSNDSANITISLYKKAFRKYIFDNKKQLDSYLRQEYTSYSGFMSNYGNSFKDWQSETNNFKDLNGHYLGSLLDFCFELENITEYDMYDSLKVYSDCYIELLEVDFDDLENDRKKEVLK